MMKRLRNFFILFLLSTELFSCAKKNFSQEFVRRYISDTNWLHQLTYSPSKMFSLQYGMREIKFDKTGNTYLIKRNRIIDEYIFTPFSNGELAYYSKDLIKIRFSDSADCELQFVRNPKKDEYYLTPDSTISERFIINYMGKTCISEDKNLDITLQVTGIEITEVKKNRMIQGGVSRKKTPNN
jgi:hypothetical protein